jgi:ubiquinone/menaquinone biosynthesis C-methylase UbiE
MARHGVAPHVPNIKGSAEDVASMFAADSFDLVYSRNALDHSFDPITALAAMTAVCKPGGHVYLEGAINEGVNANYTGLHFWNFMPVDGDLVIWNRTTARSMSRLLGSRVMLEAKARDGQWYEVTIAKRGG